MSGTYVECPHCGKRALSVATRCPGCGSAFPARPLGRPAERPALGRLGPALAVGGVLVLAAVLVALGTRRAAAPSVSAPSDSPVVQPPAVQPAAPATTAGTAAEAPPPPDAPAPATTTLRRYARTWTNVRSGRGRATASLRVLNPGDAVLVDSLVRGWYRVVVDGRPDGYVHRSMLQVEPSAMAP